MRKNPLLVLLALLFPVVLVAAGCGDDDDSGDDTEQTDSSNDESNDDGSDESGESLSEQEVIDELARGFESALTEEQSRCVAEHIVDEIGYETLVEAGLQNEGAEVPADLQEDVNAAGLEAFEACDIEVPQP